MAGRRDKWTTIQANIENIKKWLGEGQTEKQCAKNLGIAYSTWNKYKYEKPEFVEMIADFRKPAIEEIESAMFKAACGFERKTRKAVKVRSIEYENGKKKFETEEIVYYDDIEYFKPDTTAGIFLMTNWSNGKYARDAAMLNLKKQELELKKEQAW